MIIEIDTEKELPLSCLAVKLDVSKQLLYAHVKAGKQTESRYIPEIDLRLINVPQGIPEDVSS